MIRVMTVDDHPLMREGIATVIRSQTDMELIAEPSTGGEAIALFRERRPDVTLMDLRLPDRSGIEALVTIRSEFPEARIIMLTTFEGDVEMRRALHGGARSYLLKSTPAEELLDAVREVHAGRKRIPPEIAAQIAEHVSEEPLTRREIEILQEMAGGHRNRAIGERLFIAEETVKVHIKHLMEKLGAKDRTDAGRGPYKIHFRSGSASAARRNRSCARARSVYRSWLRSSGVRRGDSGRWSISIARPDRAPSGPAEGRDALAPGYVADTTREAADDFYPGWARAIASVARERRWRPMTRADFDAQLGPEGSMLIGDADEVVEKILRHSESLGGLARVTFQMNAASLPHETMMRAIERIGTQVVPVLQKEVGAR